MLSGHVVMIKIEPSELEKFKLGMNTNSISLSPSEFAWSDAFTLVRERILKGISCKIDLYHIGSTSIPQIHSKPILDILGAVSDGPNFHNTCIDQIRLLGFEFIEDPWNTKLKYYFFKYQTREKSYINFHVYEKTCPQVENKVLFSKYLRAHPNKAAEYSDFKQNLLKSPANYGLDKIDFMNKILTEAKLWETNKR